MISGLGEKGRVGWFTLCIVYWYLVQFFNTLYLQQYLCIFYEVIKWITLLTYFCLGDFFPPPSVGLFEKQVRLAHYITTSNTYVFHECACAQIRVLRCLSAWCCHGQLSHWWWNEINSVPDRPDRKWQDTSVTLNTLCFYLTCCNISYTLVALFWLRRGGGGEGNRELAARLARLAN